MKRSTRQLTTSAALAALYVVLSFGQNLLLPGTTSAAIQFRVAEALCVFALFTPAGIYGLSVGCLIYNLTYVGALPLDFFIGTAATLLATLGMYLLREVRVWKVPLLSLMMPVVANGLCIGSELTIFIKGLPLWQNILYVSAGEAAVMFALGLPLYFALRAPRLNRRLFGD